jgi:hypothetical protein
MNVIVTIEPKSEGNRLAGRSPWPVGYFERTYGCLADDPLVIPDDPVPSPEDAE